MSTSTHPRPVDIARARAAHNVAPCDLCGTPEGPKRRAVDRLPARVPAARHGLEGALCLSCDRELREEAEERRGADRAAAMQAIQILNRLWAGQRRRPRNPPGLEVLGRYVPFARMSTKLASHVSLIEARRVFRRLGA